MSDSRQRPDFAMTDEQRRELMHTLEDFKIKVQQGRALSEDEEMRLQHALESIRQSNQSTRSAETTNAVWTAAKILSGAAAASAAGTAVGGTAAIVGGDCWISYTARSWDYCRCRSRGRRSRVL